MPDYNISDDDDDEDKGESISIYYKNNRLVEPIEKRSNPVFTLAKHQSFMMRGFVIPEKYEKVRKHLDTNFQYVLPKRELN